MSAEELEALRGKVNKVLGEPDPEDLCLICGRQMLIEHGLEPTPTCHECAQEIATDDLPRVLAEVDRLSYMLRTIRRLTDLKAGAQTRLTEIRTMADQL